MSKKGTKLTKEEELLLQDFSRHVSVRSSALFYGSGLVAGGDFTIVICRLIDGSIDWLIGTSLELFDGWMDWLIDWRFVLAFSAHTLPACCFFDSWFPGLFCAIRWIFFVALTPIWLFWRIHHMDLSVYWLAYLLVSGGCAWLIAFAYKNTKFQMKHLIANKREEGIARDINKQLQVGKE